MPPQQIRKRGIPIRQEDTKLEPEKKKLRMQVGMQAFELIASIINNQQARRRNKVEIAIQLLKEQYQDRLLANDFIDAVEVLKNNAKASVFITLQSSVIRDQWLQKNAGVYISNIIEDR
jgi:hypothetical protein